MFKKVTCTVFVLMFMAGSLVAHDMFLKLSSYFLAPNSEATVALINGTFEASENVITRDRMLDVSIVGPDDAVAHPDESQWYDKELTAYLNFKTGDAGTYVIGVSTAARPIDLSGEDFNNYLKHDGVLDALEDRKRKGILDKAAKEKYSKHVKAIVQVGDTHTDSYKQRLGYPIEIVPLSNPYKVEPNGTLDVLVLRDNKPVSNQLVYASHEGVHAHNEEGGHVEAITTRTNDNGIASVTLSESGRWYIRLIHMVETDEADYDYESNWATLTFERP